LVHLSIRLASVQKQHSEIVHRIVSSLDEKPRHTDIDMTTTDDTIAAEQRRKPLIDDLLESDARYFEAGATIVPVQGATIARMPGLESLAAGCVIQRIDAAGIPDDIDGWLEDIERRLRGWGVGHARLYLHRDAPDLETALTRRGYRSRDEVLVLKNGHSTADTAEHVSLRPVESENDWAVKLALHREMGLGPDGHLAPAGLWVAMERRRSDSGYMTPYLVVVDGEVVGAANVAPAGRALRLKNVVVQSQHRLRGIGSGAVRLLADLAGPAGKVVAGAFVLDGAPAIRMYTNVGFEVASRQTEWSRDLSSKPRHGRTGGNGYGA
jgi:GNAT superfamily N-acetyltransferase